MDSLSGNSEEDSDSNIDSGEETIARKLRWQNCNLCNATVYNFDDGNSGIADAFNIDDEDDEYVYFIKYFEEQTMTTIVDETNKYYNFNKESKPPQKSTPWVRTNLNEIFSCMQCFY